MQKLKIIAQVNSCRMIIDGDASTYDDSLFIFDGDMIRKSVSSEDDPLYIELISLQGETLDIYVRTEASGIEPNKNIETARIWRKVKK